MIFGIVSQVKFGTLGYSCDMIRYGTFSDPHDKIPGTILHKKRKYHLAIFVLKKHLDGFKSIHFVATDVQLSYL